MTRALLTSPLRATGPREAVPSAAPPGASVASRVSVSSIVLRQERFGVAVDAVVASQKAIAALHSRHVTLVEEARVAGSALHSRDASVGGPRWSEGMVAHRQLATELAAALHVSEGDARRLVTTSTALVSRFPATHAALGSGEITYRHAERIVQHSLLLPDECLPGYEAGVLPHARRVSPQRLDTLAHAAAETAQPVTAVQRHLDAAAHRRLYLDPGADGMAYLTQYLPAVEAVAIHNRATESARSAKNAGDPRTLTQLKVDALTDLMLNADTHIPTITSGIRARVHITVPALTLLGTPGPSTPGPTTHGPSTPGPSTPGPSTPGPATSVATGSRNAATGPHAPGPATLEGYGPIDRLTALTLTRHAPSFHRVLTDPATGAVLSYGRTRYKPPADLDELIRLTHTECTFPTDCTTSATADLDHTIDYNNGGHTSYGNLSPLCATHHKVKHHTEWRIEQDPHGTLTWTSPAGHTYTIPPSTPHTPKISSTTHNPDHDHEPDPERAHDPEPDHDHERGASAGAPGAAEDSADIDLPPPF